MRALWARLGVLAHSPGLVRNATRVLTFGALKDTGVARSASRGGVGAPSHSSGPQPARLLVASALAWLALTGCRGDDAQAPESEAPVAVGAETDRAKADAGKGPGTATQGTGDGANAKSSRQRVNEFRSMATDSLAAQAPEVPVVVAEVQRGVVEAYYEGSTNLTAAEEAVVVARTRGVVEAVFAEEGDVVQAAQPLAQLETERLALELARSQAQLDRLEAAYERAKRMFEARMISPNDYDDAKFAYEGERTNLRLREYELKEATIRATIDGAVTRRHIKVGHTLNQNAPAFEMKRLDAIEAELNVPEREIGNIRPGQYARVRVDALPDERFEGEVARVAPEVDPTSGTFRVTVTLTNEERRLKPGMFARVDVRVDRRPNALLTPLAAVVARRDNSSLFVVDGGIVERRAVTTGYVSDGKIEIVSGADEGEWVVTIGQEGLRNGVRVRIVDGPLGSE